MAVGFILITTKPGFENSVRDALSNVELVTGRWSVFGEYDIFVKIEAADEGDLTRCIIEDVRSIKGIVDTRTLIGAEV
ncbi:MAG: Lrp/AsnC ligand binding domain-containing protein [Candidatus Thalassarchaeaceae archaeon]|jgi:DNA-binding Lrp family transcriptional regulator|nr:Lrp/AsnC ligand binding domain-containing protein [Candidatus Thalassarchaeaceae archaeon]